jgi:hypothetical protein
VITTNSILIKFIVTQLNNSLLSGTKRTITFSKPITAPYLETNSDHTFRRNSSYHSANTQTNKQTNKLYNLQAPSVSTDYFTLHPQAKLDTIIISQLAAGTA